MITCNAEAWTKHYSDFTAGPNGSPSEQQLGLRSIQRPAPALSLKIGLTGWKHEYAYDVNKSLGVAVFSEAFATSIQHYSVYVYYKSKGSVLGFAIT